MMYFPPGDYYVGDLCYVMADSEQFLDLVCRAYDRSHWRGSVSVVYRNLPVWLATTAYGDGGYTDNDGREYGVDSGSIGLAPLALCDPEKLHDLNGLGHIITFPRGVTPQWRDGVFTFADMVIDTAHGQQ